MGLRLGGIITLMSKVTCILTVAKGDVILCTIAKGVGLPELWLGRNL